MRRHNPPPDYIDKAEDLEKLLRPITIASFYAIFGIIFAVMVGLLFAILVHGSYLNPTQPVMTAFIVIGCAPLSFALIALLVAPHDPVSSYISKLAKAWRKPIDVIPEECVFHELMADGEGVCFKVSFVYPEKNQTQYVKERLYTYVNSALAKECSTRVTIPSPQEVEEIIDPPMEIMATEYGIPVMYSEIREVFKIAWRLQRSHRLHPRILAHRNLPVNSPPKGPDWQSRRQKFAKTSPLPSHLDFCQVLQQQAGRKHLISRRIKVHPNC